MTARLRGIVLRHPFAVLAALSPVVAALLLRFGPVAGFAVAMYLSMTVWIVRRLVARDAVKDTVTALVDAIEATVGDLRAGITPDGQGLTIRVQRVLAASATPSAPAVRAATLRLESARRVSEYLGTPLIDLLERVEADLRAAQALRQSADVQTSAAYASAFVLMVLPAAGLFCAVAMGVDPIDRLLHTRLGAACTVLAVTLQSAGLFVTFRMVDFLSREAWR
ncbi:type II secretion system F family protein [Dactylosporangium sucinum]|uniref:Type II secretion system protein GspF domain-containing protein n=1 Tax=Dactylosporangium sucinum TaxID=1424081 RepID=A0A917WXQ7_9ACTN|nr:hypothetical protein [Dactylosporangium sucinum]GGM39207.1 hypothetical protein GCM10007977_045790 [Dactylosporangium sucinum]